MLMSWRHSGFNVFCGPKIHPRQEQAMASGSESLRLAEKSWPDILVRLWRIIRASFSQERMTYVPKEAKVMYESKDGKQEKVFDALECPALLNFPKGTLFNRVNGRVFSRTKQG